jgi:hypothetical protein
MTTRVLLWSALLVAVLFGLYLLVPGPGLPRLDVTKWHNRTVELHGRCEMSMTPLTPLFRLYIEGREIDAEKVEAAYQAYADGVTLATREFGWLTPPEDPLCRKLGEVLDEYLDLQKEMVEQFRALLDDMLAANPPEKEDVKHAHGILKELDSRRKELQAALKEAKRAVTDKFER